MNLTRTRDLLSVGELLSKSQSHTAKISSTVNCIVGEKSMCTDLLPALEMGRRKPATPFHYEGYSITERSNGLGEILNSKHK